MVETLTEEIDLLMVDEFQDTSPIQLALFLKLARLAKHVVWVGDVKQAIYGFRGGDAALMRSVLTALPAMGGSKETLQYSFRSRPALVALVNELFGTAFTGLPPADVHLMPKRLEYTRDAGGGGLASRGPRRRGPLPGDRLRSCQTRERGDSGQGSRR